MVETTTATDFGNAYVRFREYMGDKRWTAEQLRNGFKQLTLVYLRLREPAAVIARIAVQYDALAQEYQIREALRTRTC